MRIFHGFKSYDIALIIGKCHVTACRKMKDPAKFTKLEMDAILQAERSGLWGKKVVKRVKK